MSAKSSDTATSTTNYYDSDDEQEFLDALESHGTQTLQEQSESGPAILGPPSEASRSWWSYLPGGASRGSSSSVEVFPETVSRPCSAAGEDTFHDIPTSTPGAFPNERDLEVDTLTQEIASLRRKIERLESRKPSDSTLAQRISAFAEVKALHWLAGRHGKVVRSAERTSTAVQTDPTTSRWWPTTSIWKPETMANWIPTTVSIAASGVSTYAKAGSRWVGDTFTAGREWVGSTIAAARDTVLDNARWAMGYDPEGGVSKSRGWSWWNERVASSRGGLPDNGHAVPSLVSL